MLNPQEMAAVEANLFAGARWIARERPDLPWHRDKAHTVTAAVRHSSQALALDFFATLDRLESRDSIVSALAEKLGLPCQGPWTITPEYPVPSQLLGEPRPTQVDVLLEGDQSLILVECKFTEADGGSCSQPQPIPKGPNKGLRQCNGNYEVQINPVSQTRGRCALTGKGIRYWDIVHEVLTVDAEVDHRPCPFAGGWYQWMRNLVAAAALGRSRCKRSAVVLAYAEGPFAMSTHLNGEGWRRFITLLKDVVPFQALPYQGLLTMSSESASDIDQEILASCREWIEHKIRSVGS